MKKLFIGLAVLLGACTTAQQQTAQQDAAKAKQIISNGCLIVQPTLTSVQVLDPALAPFVVANGAFCAAVNAVNVTSISTMVGTSIPQAEALVNASVLIPADKKPLIIGALTAFQVALSSAMVVLNQQAPIAILPASGAAVPLGASS